jgi:hypothetical protein
VSTLWSLLIQANAVYRSTNTSKSPVFSLFLYFECVYDLTHFLSSSPQARNWLWSRARYQLGNGTTTITETGSGSDDPESKGYGKHGK